MMRDSQPLKQLIDYERCDQHHAVGPVAPDPADPGYQDGYWQAVSFRVGDVQLLVDVSNVLELLTLPEVTAIPGTKRWFLGVANIRGELLTVIDFGDFLAKPRIKPGKQVRMLVINHDDVRSGLIVDQVYGIRHLVVGKQCDDVDGSVQESVRAILKGYFAEDGEKFHIMSIEKLINETGFMQATV